MNCQLVSCTPALVRKVKNRLFTGSTILFGGLMFANAIGYIYFVAMARMMSPSDYGALVTLTSVSYVLAVVMRTIQAAVIKISSIGQEGETGQLRPVLALSMRILLPLGAAVFAGHWLASTWVADFLQLRDASPVIVLGLYTFSSFIVPVPRGMLLGRNRLVMASAIHVLEPLVRFAAGIALVIWGLSVNGGIAAYAIGNVVAFALGLLILRRQLGRPAEWEKKSEITWRLDRYGLAVLLINASLMIISSVDQIAVKHYFSEQVAGNYAVAFLLGRVIAMSAISFGWVVFTRSATMREDDSRRSRFLLSALLIIGALSATLTLGYLVAPRFFIGLMGGSKYSFADTYVGLVGIEMTIFALVYTLAYYHISIKKTQILLPLCLAVVLEFASIILFHKTVLQILLSLIIVMAALLLCISGLSWRMLREHRRSTSLLARASSGTAVGTTQGGSRA